MADNKTSHEEKISLLRQMKSLLEQRTARKNATPSSHSSSILTVQS